MSTKIIIVFLLIACTCYAKDSFTITHGPYLQQVNETEVSIIWTTNKEAIGWIETAPNDTTHFYASERPKIFSSSHGIKNISTFHCVRLKNLLPGNTYRYRIFSQEVLKRTGSTITYGNYASSQVFQKKTLDFKTLDSKKKEINFAMLNDIHGNNDLMKALLKHVNWNKMDFMLFNGDMASQINSEDQLFESFVDTAVETFASKIPFFYCRGNHETRGEFAFTFPRYFPAADNKLYYTIQQGPAFFIVLDCGEDKPDSDIEYYNIAAFDSYRTEQSEWLSSVVQTEAFCKSPFKIAVLHIPPVENPWHGAKDIIAKFLPILNKANIDVMLSGHAHKYKQYPSTSDHNHFPIIVNGNDLLLSASANDKELKFQITDVNGKITDTINIYRKNESDSR